MEEKITRINTINSKTIGKKITVKCIVDGITQTGGPTLFTVSDGSGTFVAKAFDGAGVRAYPSINMGDVIRVLMEVREYNDAIEGEVIKMFKLQGADEKAFKDGLVAELKQRAEPEKVEFMVKAQTLDKLKSKFMDAAREIRLAIMQSRPIIVRHHNDADGYSSGYALERAILPLVKKQHGTEKALRTYYSRAPSNSPFYEIEDSIKDTAISLMDFVKFSEKIPLIVIVDTGSSRESLLAIKQGKVHGIDFIVVDHHFFEEDFISKEVLVHINPFLVGEDGSKYSAGMLCAELARFIHPTDSIEHIPALAGMADMINNPEVMDQYLAIAAKKGYDRELLGKISGVIDFVSTKLRFMEAREYVEVMFGESVQQQKKLVDVLSPHIRGMEEKALTIGKALVQREKHGKTGLNMFFLEQAYSRGAYPKPGKSNGMLHDFERKAQPRLVSAGVLSDAITFRATDETGFSVHALMDFMAKELPDAFVEGGGHKSAGAIRFVPMMQQQVLDKVREFVSKL